MRPGLRRFVLTAHVACSVGWLGAAAAYLALGVFAAARGDAQIVRVAYVAMEPIGWLAIVPLALASVLSGLVVSLGTSWGLFQHYWVVFKFALTVLAATILLLHMPAVSALAAAAAETGRADPGGLRSELLHAGGGLVVLILTTVLGVYKPRGLTPYGRRKQREPSGNAASTPRWVKVSGVILVVLILLVLGLMLFGAGRHGPGRHASTAASEAVAGRYS